ncbi:filamin-A isoform X1 [Anopheles ziemanni]|uniref:filamin-A isoform X1 n=1 Tax=Anopheles coustani TaxID=139045 RepID=UPI00265A46B6|nr:filamin-A isoform X1 [Anopheles coustani]XP_058169512.1 filamin-A isoform X1 [Anopheles ziemanni]
MELPKGAKITHAGLLQHTPDGKTELQKITQAGLVARSPEGTAAKGMNIRGNEDLWVEIQANTFKNWVNEHLRESGLQVIEFHEDFCDGTLLCALVEGLQKRPLKPSWNKRPANQHHFLENVTTALNAIEADGVKLVNIGNVDIVNGNVKLILGLIWSLIVRYQIGRSKFPPRKLMLAWLQAALPDCRVSNLTTDWNSGVLLSALLDYCEPGLFPHWRSLNGNESVRNCERAMNLAYERFGIPKVLEPEYLASRWLDELSGMTYLSYFMRPGGPGYNATMKWVNGQIRRPVTNFTTDFNDGKVFCEIIKDLGGPVPDPAKLSSDPSQWENNQQKVIDGGLKLGVKPVLAAKDMATADEEHLGVMAYTTWLRWVIPRPPLANMLTVHLDSTSGRVGEPTNFRVEALSRDVDLAKVRAYISMPNTTTLHPVKLGPRGEGSFVPDKYGMHEIVLEIDDNQLGGHFFRVLPRLVHVAPPGMAPCALGSLVEVLVNATGAPKTEDILVTAYSPSGRPLKCPLKKVDEGHSAIFKPDEAGVWEIAITYQGRHIQGGPFTCAVFDPSGVSVHGLDGAMPLRAHSFEVDARGVGVAGELHVDIVHEKRSLVCSVERLQENKYQVTFMPRANGKHRVYVYFNGYDVKGSPFIMKVGSKGRSGKTRTSPHQHDGKLRSESPSYHFNSSSLTRKATESSSARRDIYSPQPPAPKSGSRSPQDYENSFLRKETYTSRVMSPARHSPSPKLLYSTTEPDYGFRRSTELLAQRRDSDELKSPVRDEAGFNSYVKTIRTENHTTKTVRSTMLDSESPTIAHIRASPGLKSPQTVSATLHHDAGLRANRTASPKPLITTTTTTSTRYIPSPVLEPVRVASPIAMHEKSNGTYKVTERNSTYKSTVTRDLVCDSPTFERVLRSPPSAANNTSTTTVDYSSNIKVNAGANGGGQPSRRDSYDVINKTKHLFSQNSLESLANLTERQLNTDLTYDRSTLDNQTEKNTHFNKFSLGTDRPKPTLIDDEGLYRSGGYLKNYRTESNERFEKYSTAQLKSGGSFEPIGRDVSGARAIRVQDIPDGVLGRPVEFEIDGSQAGSGNLEILVNGGRVTSAVRALGNQRFIASFTPHESGVHTVQITFNEETVPGSPWNINIMSSPGLTALGESTRLVPANLPAVFEVLPPPGASIRGSDCVATVLSPSKTKVSARVTHESANGALRIEFVPSEVGTHIVEAAIGGTSLVGGPLIAKVYDSSLIQVTDVNGGVVGQPCQFRVDASAAGEGQLEISINEGEVPNHVQVVGGGRCLVSFTPEQAKPHLIDIKFNGETVIGCPFVCSVADTSRVLLNLANLELIPVNRPASFHITVSGGGAAELAVSVRGPQGELPVRVTGDIHAGFTAEFTPNHVGAHTINVEYNGYPVQGTPFVAKSYDATKVAVGSVSKGTVGRPVQFTVDAGDAGEGNLEITISAKGHNIPTQVHPQGNAKFAVSFVPAEPCEHIINVSFNKMLVPGCPITVIINGGTTGPQVSLGGPGPLHMPNSLVINHAGGRLEDIEVNVEGPSGHSVPAQVLQTADGVFKAEFVPRVVGEHRVSVSVEGQPTVGSPYSAKVYDVTAIKVKNVNNGTVGKPVVFLVETSQAGPGNLEVTVNGGRVPTSAQAQGQHTYAISFTPREAQNHTVELRFNGQDVPGSPFTCKVSPAARIVSGDLTDKVSVGQVFDFVVESDIAPVVEVLGPARRPVRADIVPATPLGYRVKFEPVEVGDHSVEVRLPGSGHVEGSPFLLKAYSAEKVVVTDIRAGVVGKSVSFGINASQAGAGNLEIIVAVGGKNVPNFVQSEGNARFKVNFKPTEAATHSLSVRFNGFPVPGSPFACHVTHAPVSLSKAIATGDCLRQAPVKCENVFELEGFDGIDPQVLITSPAGDTVASRVNYRDDIHLVSFVPTSVGRHLISVTANDQHINGSPFSCNVFDVSRVSISGLDTRSTMASLGVPLTFSVDAAGAGEGTLELVVSTATSTVKAEVTACARGLYDVTFIPQSCEPHFVNITFNDLSVDGSPFRCEVQQNTQHVQVGNSTLIELIAEDQTVEIFDPENKLVPFTLTRKAAEFKATKIGQYVVRYIDQETRNFIAARTINVFDPSMVKIVEVGEAYCHKPASIVVNANEAGQGTLTSMVRCGGLEVPHSIRGTSNSGIWEIVYHPTRVAPHKIMILYNQVPISNKAIEINVLAPAMSKEITVNGLGLYQARVGKTTSFAIDTVGHPAREFDVVVSGPGGQALPVRCYQTKGGHLQAEFTVQKVGQCLIDVLHQSKPLMGSPYTCESYDPTKIQLQKVPKMNLCNNSPISWIVQSESAGVAEIEVTVLSPTGQNVPVKLTQQDDYEHQIEFVPQAAGHYKASIMYGGEAVPNSPITFAVQSVGGKTDSHASGNGLEVAHRGKETSFVVFCPTAPNVQIERSDEQAERIEPRIKNLGNNQWKIFYTILTVGRYEIRASCTNRGPLPGSPWNISCLDPAKVTPIGGWGSLLDGSGKLVLPSKIVFDTSMAGPGELMCYVDDAEVMVEKQANGKSVLFLSDDGLAKGEHNFDLTWSGLPISQSPGFVYVTGMSVGSDKVVLTGRGLTTAQVGEVSHFTIDATDALSGKPEVHMAYEDGEPLPVTLLQPRPNELIWLASYNPHKSTGGPLSLEVEWNGRTIKGCPLTISVGPAVDAAKVLCSGEGLRNGVVGREIKSWIDTRRAGPGELTAHCAGPRKVAYCELYDHGDATFTLNVKPQEPGRHTLTIKYGGQHVPGSPYTLRVVGAPDASKVRVYGPGIEHGVLATFQSRFIVDTRGAGAGQLTVRVRGPKGAFRVEMQRESQKDRTILCKYDPTEPGDYRVEVKWAGELVPGSPFPVLIFDTQEELKRFLHGN